MLTQSQENLIEKIQSQLLGQLNIMKLSLDEIMDANKLIDLGVITFKTTRRKNKSRRFIVIKEGVEG